MTTKKLGAEALLSEQGGLATLSFPRFADPKILKHAVSTRLGGVSQGSHRSLNISYKVTDDPVRVSENRSLLRSALGMDLTQAAWVDQVHSDKVLKLDAANRPKSGGSLGEGDAIITNESQIPIFIFIADCLPILFFDPTHQAIGLAHAGWRGTVSHIAAKTLLAMGEAFGTRPEEVRTVLGPCIGSCCYEVGQEVFQRITDVFPWGGEVLSGASKNHWKLDLSGANARQLLEIGMKEENLIRSEICTIKNNELFYSHRAEADPNEPTGRFGAFLMLNS